MFKNTFISNKYCYVQLSGITPIKYFKKKRLYHDIQYLSGGMSNSTLFCITLR